MKTLSELTVMAVMWAASHITVEGAQVGADSLAQQRSHHEVASLPCTPCVQEPCAWNSPCMPDFSDVKPDLPITKADVQAANQQAFINQVVIDEDRRIQEKAMAIFKEESDAANKRQHLLDEQAEKKRQAKLAIDKARQQAAEELANSTAAIVQNTFDKLTRHAQASQLSEDQRVVAEMLRVHAQKSANAARDVRSRANEDHWKAQLATKVAEEVAQMADESKHNALLRSEEASKVATKTKEMQKEAKARGIEAARKAAKHVLQAQRSVRGLKVAARKAVKDMAEADAVIGDAQAAPLAFSVGVQQGIGGD